MEMACQIDHVMYLIDWKLKTRISASFRGIYVSRISSMEEQNLLVVVRILVVQVVPLSELFLDSISLINTQSIQRISGKLCIVEKLD